MIKLAYKRWLIAGIVFLVFAILVWFGGPFLPIGENRPFGTVGVRVTIIVVVLLVWIAIEAFVLWRIGRRSKQLVDGLMQDNENEKQTREESSELAGRFNQAMVALKSAKFGNASGKAALYHLPWYMFIGAPGSGKTTALERSGLRFPLAQPGATKVELSGIGGTRNCDWWFTDQAVLIDTAGRYTTQDSNVTVDASAWRTFLALLKRFRPRQPINGIIVTLSIGDLLTYTSVERLRYAQTIRQRIDELQSELGLEFPVYVMVTKVDLVSGFSEFFATFDADQRAQVWGITFDVDLQTRVAEDAKAAFDVQFPTIVGKLNDLLFQRLQEERDSERRAVMYPFPQQFATFGPMIGEFLDTAFSPSQLQSRPMVRGIYFTSATQEGSPIDRLLSTLSRSLSLSSRSVRSQPTLGASKSFFVNRLLTDLVFPEAALAGFNERRRTMLRRWALGLIVVSGVLSVAYIAAMTVSWFGNRAAIAETAKPVKEAAEQLALVARPADDDLPSLIDALDDIVMIPRVFNDPIDRPPLRMRFGLYQGRSLDDEIGGKYQDALARGLLPRVASQLETIMRDPRSSPEVAYGALKTYLMLYQPEHMDRAWFAASVASIWSGKYERAVMVAARPHFERLATLSDLSIGNYHERDEAAVANARQKAASLSAVDRAFDQLRKAAESRTTPFDVAGAAGSLRQFVFTNDPIWQTPVPGMYTPEGYRGFARTQIGATVDQVANEEAWVMKGSGPTGAKPNPADIEKGVANRYFGEYIKAWDAVSRGVAVKRLDGPADAAGVAQRLAGPDSPLRNIVMAIDRETRLVETDAVQGVKSQAGDAVTDKVAQSIDRVTGQSAGRTIAKTGRSMLGRSGPRLSDGEVEVEKYFEGVHRLAGDGKSGQITEVMQQFKQLADGLAELQRAKSAGQQLPMPTSLSAVKSGASQFAEPAGKTLLSVAGYSTQTAAASAGDDWRTSLNAASATCRKATKGKYPFVATSKEDLGTQDLADIFRSGGDLNGYFTSKLAQYVDQSGTWRLKGTGEGAPQVPGEAIRQFQIAEDIRRAFVGSGVVEVKAWISVITAPGDITIEYDGTPTVIHLGGQSAPLTWPRSSGQLRILSGSQVVVSADGAWAPFRVFDKEHLESGSGDRLRFAYPATTGGKVVLELRSTSSAFNPFNLPSLSAFRCPQV